MRGPDFSGPRRRDDCPAMSDENPLFAPFAPPSTGDSTLSGSGSVPPPNGSAPPYGSAPVAAQPPSAVPPVPGYWAQPGYPPGPYSAQPGYPPGPGYWAPPGSVYTPPPSGPNGASIAALVTACLGLGIIPLILGMVGLAAEPRGSRGRIFAWVGIALGAVETVAWIALVVAIVSSGMNGPYSYGDDPQLDRLYDSCESGAMQACDDLYDQSPAGSDYEWFGLTCGERSDEDTELYCTEQDLVKDPITV